MLTAEGVTKTYVTGAGSLTVLRGVSLRVAPGESIAVTGPSGAGKSTLLHLLAGLDTPTAGDVRWEDASLARMSERQRARFRNRTIGIVFQAYHLLPELTALENVLLPGRVGGAHASQHLKQRALGALDDVGLGHRAEHRPNQLSGGEQQRVAIARALVMEPPVLLCDEPTGNLDSKTGAEVINVIFAAHRKRKMSLVLVTHEAKLAAMAQRRIALEDGLIVNG